MKYLFLIFINSNSLIFLINVKNLYIFIFDIFFNQKNTALRKFALFNELVKQPQEATLPHTCGGKEGII